METVYIGLGSNLDTPKQQLTSAIQALKNLPGSVWGIVSSFYLSKPMGPQDQPDYINAVAMIKTELTPHQLLDELQEIENQQGRVRKQRWGARTLDLDVLLYGQQFISDERLQVPHPGIAERNFVLFPLAEIAEDLHIPIDEVNSVALSKLCANSNHDGLTRLDAN